MLFANGNDNAIPNSDTNTINEYPVKEVKVKSLSTLIFISISISLSSIRNACYMFVIELVSQET